MQKLGFPQIYVVELLLWMLLLAAGFVTVSFLAAEPIAHLNATGAALPNSWEAAVPNHGGFYHWYLPENHRVPFSLSAILLVLSAVGMFFLHNSQAKLRRADGPSRLGAHRVANLIVVAVLGIGAFLVLQFVLPRL